MLFDELLFLLTEAKNNISYAFLYYIAYLNNQPKMILQLFHTIKLILSQSVTNIE